MFYNWFKTLLIINYKISDLMSFDNIESSVVLHNIIQ